MSNRIKKYLTLIEVTWQRALAYRFTVLAYRIGEMLEVIIMVFMWSAIYESQPVIKGYSLNEMISYVLVGNLIDVAVRNWMPNVIASDIKNGTLSTFLTKPINYMHYMFFKEAGRNSFAFIFSFATQIMIILFFIDRVVINFNLEMIAVLLFMVLLAFIIEWQISYLVGLIAFWTDEVEGIYTTVIQVRKFFAGGYFPLSLLPAFFVSLSFALPFAYSFFIPTQLYLGKINIETGIKGLLVQIIWIILLHIIIKFTWNKGLKRYEGVGI
jgi:ABC-2 type transport system permease protein